MPQLVKGGRWVFGWAVVGAGGSLPIPPAAWTEYGFRAGDTAIFVRGSARSDGFSISTPARWPATFAAWEGNPRVLGTGTLTASHGAAVPPEVGLKPRDRLLVVRGSGVGLGFAARGRICAEAREHPELEVFRQS